MGGGRLTQVKARQLLVGEERGFLHLLLGGMGQEEIYTHQGGGAAFPRWGGGRGQEWASALTIGSFPTHVTLHKRDDPDAGC